MTDLHVGLERIGRGDIVRAIQVRMNETRWGRRRRKWRRYLVKRLPAAP